MSKLLVAAIFALLLLRSGSHGSGDDRIALFSTIDIEEGQTAGDVACAFCTVNIRGEVAGDVAVLFGTVSVDPNRTVSGDVAIVFSTLKLRESDRIKGDLAAVLSTTDISSSASVGGNRATVTSRFGIGLLVGPVLILAGVIGLLIYFVRRNRYPYPV